MNAKAQWIQTDSQFHELCEEIRAAGMVAFDTEFVSESTYRPELCLMQFATPLRAVAVDPFEIGDLTPWWQIMAAGETTVIVHGGREEVRFCLAAGYRPSPLLVDIQIAEGLRGRTFPLGYETLVKRVVGKSVRSDQTRTDWRRRPLSASQIEYGLDDVRHVIPVWDAQRKWLEDQGRLTWAFDEFARMVDEVAAERGPNAWQKLSGLNRLSRRELALVREIFAWREREAVSLDRPARRILRDDLIVEVARRKPKTASDLLATRDFQRGDYKKHASALLKCLATAYEVPDGECPAKLPARDDDATHDEQVLGQFLSLALANRCAELNVAQSLVATMSDLREFVRWLRDGRPKKTEPRLSNGWRAEVCGDLLADVLAGGISIRVANPDSEHPLTFEKRAPEGKPPREAKEPREPKERAEKEKDKDKEKEKDNKEK